MYKLKGFILSVTIVSLLYFSNVGLGVPTVRGPARWTFKPGLSGPVIFYYLPNSYML